MIAALFGDLLPWLAGIGAAIAGLWAYGRSQRAQGAAAAERKVEQQVAAANRRMLEVVPAKDSDVDERLKKGTF